MSGPSRASAIRDETRTICGDVIFYLSFVAAHHRGQSAGFGRLEPRSATESLTEICAASVENPSCELDCSKDMRGGSVEGGQRCIRWRDKEGDGGTSYVSTEGSSECCSVIDGFLALIASGKRTTLAGTPSERWNKLLMSLIRLLFGGINGEQLSNASHAHTRPAEMTFARHGPQETRFRSRLPSNRTSVLLFRYRLALSSVFPSIERG